MAGRCFSLPVRVEHILSKQRNFSMNTKFYLKTVTFAVSFVFVFGIAGLNGKVKSEGSADNIIKKQENGYTVNPVSSFKKEQNRLQKKNSNFEMIQEQDKENAGVISSAGKTLPAESSYKPVLKSISSASEVEHAGIQTAEGPEKKTESVSAVLEPALSTDSENNDLPAQNESPVKTSSDSANVPETRGAEPENEDAAAYISRGVSCLKKGQIEDAISDFNKAIDIDPRDAVAYIARGSAYYKLNRFDNALTDYNRAIDLNPGYANAYINRGACYNAIKKYNKAIADYKKATELKPEPVFVRILMKYRSYETASYLIRIINNPSYAENTMTLRYMQY